MHSLTIRMGAVHWDATLHNPHTVFNFRTMTRDERRAWYRAFMDSVRAVYGKGEVHRPRRSKAGARRRRGGRRRGAPSAGL